MKYWWLKKYKGLKIKLIPDLTNDVNTYFVMPKHYKERYLAIKNSDISKMEEEDLRISLYFILNYEKIKNNRVILIIDQLLGIPDNFLPATDYSIEELFAEIYRLKDLEAEEEKLSSNNVAACHNCLQVFYIDKIKYVNKKGVCLCPYCKSSSLYFDNDFLPMDENFLRLYRLVYGITELGCNFKNLQHLLKKCVKLEEIFPKTGSGESTVFIKKSKKADIILESNHIEFKLEEIKCKKEITSKEEEMLHYRLNECFQMIEKNILSKVIIDVSIVPKKYPMYLTFLVFLLEILGKNPYLKEIILVCENKEEKKIYKDLIDSVLKFGKQRANC